MTFMKQACTARNEEIIVCFVLASSSLRAKNWTKQIATLIEYFSLHTYTSYQKLNDPIIVIGAANSTLFASP